MLGMCPLVFSVQPTCAISELFCDPALKLFSTLTPLPTVGTTAMRGLLGKGPGSHGSKPQ